MGKLIAALSLGLGLVGVAVAGGPAETPRSPVIRITHPAQGAVVTAHPVLVRGTIDPADPEVRLLANGQALLLLQGGEWAGLVELPAGAHTLVVEARGRGRVLSQAETRVTVAGPVPDTTPIMSFGTFTSKRVISIGTPPYRAGFAVNVRETRQVRFDPDGTGRVTEPIVLGAPYVGAPYHRTYEAPGVFAPLLYDQDEAGRAVVRQLLVVVLDRDWLEPILQATWTRYLAAMARGDLDEVVSLTHTVKRQEIRLGLEQFGPGELRALAAMAAGGPLRLERVADGRATCSHQRGGEVMPVPFEWDLMVGLWRLRT